MRVVANSIDPDQSAKGPRMRVIGAGLPRCATSSLQAALETPFMGYFPCMHMAHIVPSASRAQLLIDALQEKDTQKRRKLLHKMFDGYEATTDFPGVFFLDDLMDMYPDAPLILNQRSGGPAAWAKSVESSLSFFGTLPYYLLCFPIKTDRLHWTIHQIVKRVTVEKWGMNFCPEFYDMYQDWVHQEAAKRGRKVIVWKAEDGWEPLCKFLGKAVPKNEPFPWVNDAATMKMVKRVLIARGILSWVAIFGGAYASWRYLPQLASFASSNMGFLWKS